MENKTMHLISFTLVAVGGLNWGLVGLFNLNLVELIFGNWPLVIRIVYVLVGAATVMLIATHKNDCEACKGMKDHGPMSPTDGQAV